MRDVVGGVVVAVVVSVEEEQEEEEEESHRDLSEISPRFERGLALQLVLVHMRQLSSKSTYTASSAYCVHLCYICSVQLQVLRLSHCTPSWSMVPVCFRELSSNCGHGSCGAP